MNERKATSSKPLAAILTGGAAAGILDITAACVTWAIRANIKPIRIFQSVAAGWLGNAAYDGGWPTAVLGLASHFLIATTAAVVYYAVSRKLTFLIRQAVLSGFVYGILVQLFMSRIVVPLSHVVRRPSPFSLMNLIIGLLTHMFCVGLPIALAAKRYSKVTP